MRRAQLSEAVHSIKRYAGLSPREEPKTLRTFVSLRFKGDRLAPSRVTDILNTLPTLAYRTGEVYKRDQGHVVRGLTNLWLLSSKELVNSTDLNEHLHYLLLVLYPPNSDEPVKRLHNLIRESQVEADVGCFWYGARGARRPIISERVRNAFERLPARIELDFGTQ